MKAVELIGFDGISSLRVAEIAKPKPGASEVLLEVKAAGINFAEIEMTKGRYPAEVKRLMSEPGFDASQYLRLGVKGGGCSGMTYVLGFDKQEEDDEMFAIDGVPVVMKNSHGMYLFEMTVDFSDGLNARGFVFNNPNASTTCGCGSSFGV